MRLLDRSPRAIAVALVAFATLAAACQNGESPENRLREAVAEMEYRPVALRLSGAAYAPPARVLRAGREDEDASGLRLKSVALSIASGTADAHTAALAALLAGRREQATAILRKVATQTRQAGPWNDLAVATFERAAATDDVRGIAHALAAADEALRREASIEALFNRAAILEALKLRDAAATAWDAYLRADSSSAWADEARARRDAAGRPTSRGRWKDVRPELDRAALAGHRDNVVSIVRAHPHESRTWCEGEYLAQWAEAARRGEKKNADQHLAVARAVGRELKAINGERLLSAAVDAIDRAQAANDLALTGALIEAHRAYKLGRIALNRGKPTAALPDLDRAEQLFIKGGSPMALVSRYYRAQIVVDHRRLRDAATLLASIDRAASADFLALRANVLWELSRAAARAGRFYESLEHARTATQLFLRIGEREHTAQTQIIVAAALAILGQSGAAWTIRREIFDTASDCGAPWVIEQALHSAARDEIVEGELMMARAVFDVMLGAAEHQPLLGFDARLWRTFVAARMNEATPADVAALRTAAQRIEDASLRTQALGEALFAEALLATGDTSRRVRLLTEVIEFRDGDFGAQYLPTAYVERARSARESGNLEGAIDDLERALDILDQQAGDVQERRLRDSFFASSRSACEELIEMQLLANRPLEALAATERCRGSKDFSLAAVQARLTPGDLITVFAPLRDRTAIFALTNDSFDVLSAAAGDNDLRAVVASLKDAARREDDAAFQQTGHRLSDVLVRPLRGLLANRTTWMIVGNDIIEEIPFAALPDAEHQFIANRAQTVFAPSATAWQRRASSGSAQRALVVGDPAFDRTRFPNLPRLDNSAGEARAIHALYGNSDLLTGSDASLARFRQLASQADIVHVAAHAVVSERDSAASVLLFAPSGGDDGLLYLPAIASMRLERQPVVILAGCDTATQGGGRGSIRSLASAFLAAGSRAVAGSLWPVHDDATRAFTTALHKEIRSGRDVSAAMRNAQLQMIASRDPRLNSPRVWSAFQVYGID